MSEEPGTLREATPDDVPVLLQLAAQRRAQFAQYEPQFWRAAPQAEEFQQQLFSQLFTESGVLALVHERAGTVDGFLIAVLTPPPPIYAPDGPLCSVEDLWVAGGGDWEGAGRALLEAAMQAGQASGAKHMVVVCAQQNAGQRALLSTSSYAVVAEQWVARI
ncbi:MAG TPA: GNAT family N-acetyltransferase [Ktedonobacterales bacterium]